MNDTQPLTGAAKGMAASPAVERLLRRSLLMLARAGSTVQDRLDFAELADAVDAPIVAELVRHAAMLRRGFDAARPIAERAQGSIERAVVELSHLMACDTANAAAAHVDALDATTASLALTRILSAPLDGGAEAELAGLLAAWRGLAEAAPLNLGDSVDTGLAELLAAFATHELQSFLRRNHALAFAPYGSARLLHEAARLGSGGLGPYLGSVGNIVRGSEDILGLIALAAGDRATAEVERWVVPLTNSLPEPIALALADDLADLGMIGALRGLLDAAARRPDRLPLMRHLRDGALDLGDIALALSAQHEVLGRTPYDPIEWRCMGAILATADDEAGAEAAFSYALKLNPGDSQTMAQLGALRAGDRDALAIKGGFATPLPRQRIRFARRAA